VWLFPDLVRLERTVESLQHLPGRIRALESQLQRFENEIRGEFSALRAGIGGTTHALRAEIRAGDKETRQVLRTEIRAGDKETQQQMRVLHEEVLARIAMLHRG
jgi:hypothetical protein